MIINDNSEVTNVNDNGESERTNDNGKSVVTMVNDNFKVEVTNVNDNGKSKTTNVNDRYITIMKSIYFLTPLPLYILTKHILNYESEKKQK